jgi:hypothetical protein
VQGLTQEVQHSPKHFVSCVQRFVTLVLPNVKNYRLTVVVNHVQQLAKNVLKHVQACKLKMARWILTIHLAFI